MSPITPIIWLKKREAGPRIVRAEPPLELAGRWIVPRPTRYGWLFMGVLGAMLTGALNYNNNLALFLVFLLGSMGLVSLLHTIANLIGIRILTVNARPVFAGAAAAFDLRVHPGKKTRTAVEFAFPGEEETCWDLAGSREALLKIPCAAKKRGRLNPGPLSIATVYPLGLFRCRVRIRLHATCLIYPAPLSGEFVSFAGGEGDGGEEDGMGPGGDDFKGLTPYQPGDSLRRISWQAFSRGQGLITKEFTGLTGAFPTLDFDQVDESGTERKLSRLCDMVLHAQRLHLTYGLELPGKRIEPDNGEAHGRACLGALALFASPETDP